MQRSLFDEDGSPSAGLLFECGGYLPPPPAPPRVILPVRNSDPETSRWAAESLDLPEMERIYLDALRSGPKAAFEVALVTGLRLNTLSPRPASLIRKGLTVDTGERRLNPETGRRQMVIRLTTQEERQAVNE